MLKKFRQVLDEAVEHGFTKGDHVTVPVKFEKPGGGHDVKHVKGKVRKTTKTHVHVEMTGAGIPSVWKYHHTEVKKKGLKEEALSEGVQEKDFYADVQKHFPDATKKQHKNGVTHYHDKHGREVGYHDAQTGLAGHTKQPLPKLKEGVEEVNELHTFTLQSYLEKANNKHKLEFSKDGKFLGQKKLSPRKSRLRTDGMNTAYDKILNRGDFREGVVVLQKFGEFLEEAIDADQSPKKHTIPTSLKKHGTHVRSYNAASVGLKGKLAHEHSIDHKHKDAVEADLHKKGYKQTYANTWQHKDGKHVIGLTYRNVTGGYKDPAQHKIKHDEGEKWRDD